MFNIPIILTTYKRLDNIDRIFEILNELNPEILFITSDGPSKESDKPHVEIVRNKINTLKLEGKIVKYYSHENLGIHRNYEQSLSKAFENVDKLIFIEDDVIPSLSFFYFCKFVLETYENEINIKMVNGSNFSQYTSGIHKDYLFTKRLNSSSNALWRRTFKEFQLIKNDIVYELEKFNFDNITDNKLRNHFKKWFSIQLNNTNIISAELLWTILLYKGDNYNIVYKDNLVKLGGVDSFASNTLDSLKYLPNEIKRIYSLPQIDFDISKLMKLPINWDFQYDQEIRDLLGEGDSIKLLLRNFEVLLKLLIDFRFDAIYIKLHSRLSRFLNKEITKNG